MPTFYDDRPNNRYASVTFQALAAAASLAGGCLSHAWRPDGVDRIERAAEALRAGDTKGEALRQMTVADAPFDQGVLC